jgi:hypothetical protein
MSEREADRCQPDRLQAQALVALVKEGGEISAEFKERLNSHDARPTLFGARDLTIFARSALEVRIVQNLQLGSDNGAEALATALRERGAGYVREQKCQLIADRESSATIAADCVKKACDDAATDAAALILTNQRAPANANRVQLSEDLLGQSNSGGMR